MTRLGEFGTTGHWERKRDGNSYVIRLELFRDYNDRLLRRTMRIWYPMTRNGARFSAAKRWNNAPRWRSTVSLTNGDNEACKILVTCVERVQGVRGRVEAREQWVARSGVARGGGGGGEKRVYFVAFLAVPRQWSVNVATGSQTTSCLMSQYNDGPRNSTKSKWMLPGGSPTREMITSNITRDDESYAESIPVSRTVPDLSTRGKFWIAFFFLLGTITITTFLVHSFFDPLSRGFVNFFFGRRISIWDITWYFRVSMKRKKREGMTDHFLPSSYQFIPRSLCMIIRGRVKNHDDTVISPVNTVTESVNNNP